MKRFVKLAAGAIVLATLSTGASAVAALPSTNTLTFEALTGSFNKTFSVIPLLDNQLVFGIQGSQTAFDSLSFSLTGPGTDLSVKSTVWNNTVFVTFNDIINASVSTLSNTPYMLTISGYVKDTIGGQGTVTLMTVNGDVTPVPEPGTLALMLSGLGLIGTTLRRRSKNV